MNIMILAEEVTTNVEISVVSEFWDKYGAVLSGMAVVFFLLGIAIYLAIWSVADERTKRKMKGWNEERDRLMFQEFLASMEDNSSKSHKNNQEDEK